MELNDKFPISNQISNKITKYCFRNYDFDIDLSLEIGNLKLESKVYVKIV
jgi:hypothetical protein